VDVNLRLMDLLIAAIWKIAAIRINKYRATELPALSPAHQRLACFFGSHLDSEYRGAVFEEMKNSTHHGPLRG
jgi:hypothetical protein